MKQNNSTASNYPSIKLGMTGTDINIPLVVNFDILIRIYVQFLGIVGDLVSPQHAQNLGDGQLLALSLVTLGQRLYFIKRSRSNEIVGNDMQPYSNVRSVIRPVYSVISCLGDIEVKEFGHRHQLSIPDEEITFLCDAANSIVNNGYNHGTEPLSCGLVAPQISFRNLNVLCRHVGYNGQIAAGQELVILAAIFPIRPADQQADYNLVMQGFVVWLGNPDLLNGQFNYAEMGTALQIVIIRRINDVIRSVPVIFGFYRSIINVQDRGRHQVMFSGEFQSAMIRLSTKYRCSSEVPTSSAGAPSLMAKVMRTNTAWYVQGSLAMPQSHVAMAYVCNFRYKYFLSDDYDAFQSTLIRESPAMALDLWLQSNIIRSNE